MIRSGILIVFSYYVIYESYDTLSRFFIQISIFVLRLSFKMEWSMNSKAAAWRLLDVS